MKWVKQEGGEWHRWVCSRCGTLLVRVHDDHPLPEKCPACGEAVEDNPSTAGRRSPSLYTRETLEAGKEGEDDG